VTAALASTDFRRLRALAEQWRGQHRPRAAEDLNAALDAIAARYRSGPDFLDAIVYGDSLPEMEAAALARAAGLYGPDAKLEIVSSGDVRTYGRRIGDRFTTSFRVRCLNYAEISS